MKNITFKSIIALLLISTTSCSQNKKAVEDTQTDKTIEVVKSTTPHRYGGWYCPDNLRGFPPVDIENWNTVPVINGRLATKEETQSEASLIFVDTEKYPNAKVLDITMPKLAKIFNRSTNREELIILIQAMNISNDSIVGFRYLNGGNGSARLHEVTILSDEEINKFPKGKFVTMNIEINAVEDVVWDILTNSKHATTLQPMFDEENKLNKDWRKKHNVNYYYTNSGNLIASFADKHFGSYYIQNDYNKLKYNEKLFIFMKDREKKKSTLQIVFGPFTDDYVEQKEKIEKWSEEIKKLSENVKC